MTVNETTKKLVRERAKFLCEYCHSLEEASAALFAIDHIIPQSLPGSSDDPDNLALACQRCNGYRYNFTTGIDPETGDLIPIFNPRKQKWSDHFLWSADGLKIIGIILFFFLKIKITIDSCKKSQLLKSFYSYGLRTSHGKYWWDAEIVIVR